MRHVPYPPPARFLPRKFSARWASRLMAWRSRSMCRRPASRRSRGLLCSTSAPEPPRAYCAPGPCADAARNCGRVAGVQGVGTPARTHALRWAMHYLRLDLKPLLGPSNQFQSTQHGHDFRFATRPADSLNSWPFAHWNSMPATSRSW